MTAAVPSDAIRAAAARGAPPRGALIRAVAWGAVGRLAGVALVGTATALLTWASMRPGLGRVAGLLVLVELIAFLRAPIRHTERICAHDLGLSGLGGWRTWLLSSVATWSPSRLADARAGDLLTRCLEDADSLQDLWVRVVVPWLASLAALAVAACVLGVLVPAVGIALAFVTIGLGSLCWWRAKHVCALGAEEAALRGGAAARGVEFAHGADALVLLGADAQHIAGTTSLIAKADAMAARRDAIVSVLEVAASVATGIVLVTAVAVVRLPTSAPALPAGVVLAILACGELLATFPAALEGASAVAGAAGRLSSLSSPRHWGTRAATRGALGLDKVDVAAAAETPVLIGDVDLVVKPSGSVAVIGPTGSGKSSLLAVAAGLEAPAAGRVTIDAIGFDELDEASLRARLGWLSASPALLEGRVKDVVAMGRPIDDVEVQRAIDAVGLGGVLAARGGLDAVIGSRGDDLSSGERRRLALARVLASHGDLYVLDEPTAGLDDEAARMVLDAIDASGAGVLVASHDPRVAAWAGRAYLVEDGSLTEAPYTSSDPISASG